PSFDIHKNLSLFLERVRAVRSDRILKLKQELVGRWPDGVVRTPVLSTNLAELAWPIRQHRRLSFVNERCIVRFSGMVITESGEPPPGQLIIAGDVIAPRELRPAELLPPAPGEFRASHERVVNRPL